MECLIVRLLQFGTFLYRHFVNVYHVRLGEVAVQCHKLAVACVLLQRNSIFLHRVFLLYRYRIYRNESAVVGSISRNRHHYRIGVMSRVVLCQCRPYPHLAVFQVFTYQLRCTHPTQSVGWNRSVETAVVGCLIEVALEQHCLIRHAGVYTVILRRNHLVYHRLISATILPRLQLHLAHAVTCISHTESLCVRQCLTVGHRERLHCAPLARLTAANGLYIYIVGHTLFKTCCMHTKDAVIVHQTVYNHYASVYRLILVYIHLFCGDNHVELVGIPTCMPAYRCLTVGYIRKRDVRRHGALWERTDNNAVQHYASTHVVGSFKGYLICLMIEVWQLVCLCLPFGYCLRKLGFLACRYIRQQQPVLLRVRAVIHTQHIHIGCPFVLRMVETQYRTVNTGQVHRRSYQPGRIADCLTCRVS